MSLRISTNVASLTARRYLHKADREHQETVRKLASGSKVSSPGLDAAGFAIGEQLRGDIAGLKAAQNNAQGAISLVQVAEGGLNEQFNIAVRLRELAVLSASDAVSDVERGFLNEEFNALTQEFDRIAQSTQIGRNKLLVNSGSRDFEFLVGTTGTSDDVIKFTIDADTSGSTLEIDGLSIADQDDTGDVLTTIDTALQTLGETRSKFGAVQSRFLHAVDNLEVQHENMSEAKSRLVDSDIAEETAKLAQASIIKQAAIGVLAQANQAPNMALRLIG